MPSGRSSIAGGSRGSLPYTGGPTWARVPFAGWRMIAAPRVTTYNVEMAAPLTPLSCVACGAAVPLAPGESTPCPHCGATVAIPQAYRELRDAEQVVDADRREGHELALALARVPSAPVRMLAMFDSPLFLMFGLGFWITAGVFVGVLLPPVIGRWFAVSTVDVLSPQLQSTISLVVPLGTFALGLLGAGWARKRAIVRGGLQAALAARGPERSGGPERCRQCGAALAVAARDTAVTCPYCRTDNLVNMPPAWLARMRKHAHALGREVAAARAQYDQQRRSLRTSLILRGIVGALIVLPPATCMMGATDRFGSAPIEYAAGPPADLPSWRAERSSSLPPRGLCNPEFVALGGIRMRAEDCDAEGCRYHRLVPLAHGEALRIVGDEVPPRTRVLLQVHEQTFLDDHWTTVARADVADTPVVRAGLSAWYRVALLVPDAVAGDILRACIERTD